MQRINAIDPATATGRAKELLDGVQAAMGVIPNLMKTLAHSPAALEGYLNLNKALAHGVLSPKLREQLAIAVAQDNSCDYCLSAHTFLGKRAGLGPDELAAARQGASDDQKAAAGLKFAKTIVQQRGQVSDEELAAVRQAGYTDVEITEIVGHVALNVLTNYFNVVAQTDVDFPRLKA